MHDHNNKNGGHKGMMWMMIPCLLLGLVLIFSGGKLISSGYIWLIVMLGVCVVPHIWMMRKMHQKSEDNTGSKTPDDNSVKLSETIDENDKTEHRDCCNKK